MQWQDKVCLAVETVQQNGVKETDYYFHKLFFHPKQSEES